MTFRIYQAHRHYDEPVDYGHCRTGVLIRCDTSGRIDMVQCSRKPVRRDLCEQHAKMRDAETERSE